jgi:nitroreductase
VARAARAVLPGRWYRLLRRPALVPAEYLPIVRPIEQVREMLAAPEELDAEYWAAQLRKFAHILDKGCQRGDWEPGHSAAYYDAARNAWAKVGNSPLRDDPSVVWCAEALRRYECLQRGMSISPAPNDAPAPDRALREAFWQLLRLRHSARAFADRPLERETVCEILETVNWAPRSCNRQTTRVFLTTEPSLARRCLAQCAGATGFGTTVPCFLSFTADLRPYVLPEELTLASVDVSLGVQNCCLAAGARGMSLTILSWNHHSADEDRGLRSALRIAEYYTIVFNAVMGYPLFEVESPSPKAGANTIVFVD